MSLQTLVIGGLLGPPAARGGQPCCPQPHGVVVVTVEACLKVRRPERSQMNVLWGRSQNVLSSHCRMQPTHNLVTLPRREVGDRKGRGRRGYRPSVVEVPLADVIGSALAGASATGVFCLAKRLREGK